RGGDRRRTIRGQDGPGRPATTGSAAHPVLNSPRPTDRPVPGNRSPRCPAPTLAARADEIIDTVRPSADKAGKPGRSDLLRAPTPRVQLVYGCFSAAQPEAIAVIDNRITVVAGERTSADRGEGHGNPARGRLKRVATWTSTSTAIDYAAAVEMDDDGRHEIIVVTRQEDKRDRVIQLEVLEVESGRIARNLARELYRVSATKAAWIGAQLDEIELIIELRTRSDRIDAAGLYVEHGASGLYTVAPLLPKTVVVRRKRQPSPTTPAPTTPQNAPAPTTLPASSNADKGDQTTRPAAIDAAASRADKSREAHDASPPATSAKPTAP
ncbi:MAG: hypothetical protein MJE77_28805, partial [Proteobacteria bacterium]|nr:hypothetical protein [Pseudomonadota bacterium]